jgi:DHA1 family inner membrane transport protein
MTARESDRGSFSFVFGAAISGMVYANLSAGIIKSVKRANASYASGLFVASLYIPAAFAGYLLGRLKESFGWTTAGILQISGCALIAAILTLVATAGRKRVAYA